MASKPASLGMCSVLSLSLVGKLETEVWSTLTEDICPSSISIKSFGKGVHVSQVELGAVGLEKL